MVDLSRVDLSKLSEQERREALELLEIRTRLLAENQLANYKPYSKQLEFHAAGAQYRERLLMAGNQLGKTVAGSFEMAMHLTGRYPDWWRGHRFKDPIVAWAASETSQGTRDTVQRLVLGRPGEHGTGAVPKVDLVEVKSSAHGVADAVETIRVRHVTGGVSTLTFKTYDQGRQRWQGETLDVVWFDEEPPEDVFFEGLTRTNATAGLTMMTFTPLQGFSSVVKRYLKDKPAGSAIITMTIYDAEHYTPEQREAIINSYPAHEREARAKGVPTLGSGRVFPVRDEDIMVPAFALPTHWPRVAGIDFGWDHPTAGAWLAWDRDADIVYVTDCYRVREATPIVHAAAFKARGDWIPVAWPHDGLQHDKGSGFQLSEIYREQGLNMTAERAMFPESSDGTEISRSSVEAGVLEMLNRMQTGRLKVFAHLADWFEEFRMYHRKDGKLVKEQDDILSATRYALMMLRCAITPPVSKAAISLRSRSSDWRA